MTKINYLHAWKSLNAKSECIAYSEFLPSKTVLLHLPHNDTIGKGFLCFLLILSLVLPSSGTGNLVTNDIKIHILIDHAYDLTRKLFII